MPALYPLLCTPLFKSKIWGGRKLEALFNFPLPAGEKIGEAWVAADLPEGASLIANGPLAGKPLSEARQQWGEALIGTAWRGKPTGERFPLLIKYLDAQDNLSIQVHPDTAACEKWFPNDFSKDETWIILDSEANGRILHGFKPEVTLADFDRELASGDVTETIRSLTVQPGEFFRVAPGTVHALCSGVAILEIQEPSDTTYRIYDYNRPGDDGKPRALHLDQARKVMKFDDATEPHGTAVQIAQVWGTHELLVDTPPYRIERLDIAQEFSYTVNPRTAQAFILLEGEAEVRGGETTVRLKKGDCVILPAAIGTVTVRPFSASAKAVLTGAGDAPFIA
ncbi:TPA: mannose-6-phosphate isomerase [Candidatus Sumerlaeota bacterium]|jgi:mannose-6-phosphate isomerase|nr:mannose-6-phosphate isomerase [Candidatus Sumerlaeota bacterium]